MLKVIGGAAGSGLAAHRLIAKRQLAHLSESELGGSGRMGPSTSAGKGRAYNLQGGAGGWCPDGW